MKTPSEMTNLVERWYTNGNSHPPITPKYSIAQCISMLIYDIRQQLILLSVCPSYFDVTAAASIVNGDHEVVRETLEDLVSQGLLERELGFSQFYDRYYLHPLIKSYLVKALDIKQEL